MSFFTKIRDAVTSPFRATVQLPRDIIGGKNVLSSTGKFFTQTLTAPLAVNDSFVPSGFKNPTVNTLTLGLSGDLKSATSGASRIASSNGDFSFSEARDVFVNTGKFAGKIGAVYLGAQAGGFAGAAASGSIAAKSFSNIEQGNIAGGLLGFGGIAADAGFLPEVTVPQEAKDIWGTAKNIFGGGSSSTPSSAPNGMPAESGYVSSTIPEISVSQDSKISPVLLVGAGLLVAYAIFRKKS